MSTRSKCITCGKPDYETAKLVTENAELRNRVMALEKVVGLYCGPVLQKYACEHADELIEEWKNGSTT